MSAIIPTEKLRERLQSLVDKTVMAVSAWKQSGRLVLRRQKYTVRPNFNLRYTVDPTITNFPIEEVEQEFWDTEDVELFIKEMIEPLPDYQDLLGLADTTSAETLARSFVWRVAYESATNSGSASGEQHIETLLNDLSGKGEREYKAKIWLSGINTQRNDSRSLRLADFS